MKFAKILIAFLAFPSLLVAQSGSIRWPAACPSNGCTSPFTDANGVQTTVTTTYGTGTGIPVNLTTLQGTTAGPLGIAISSSAASTTEGLGVTMNYGTNYTDATTGNLVTITFNKAVQGISFALFDITSPTLNCSSYGINGSIYNDMVVVTGVDIHGNTVDAIVTELARGAYNSASRPTYVPGSPSYIVADQISVSGNQAYTTGGYINTSGVANNQTTNPGSYAVSADLSLSFPVAVTSIRVLYKNYSGTTGDYFSFYKTNNNCPATLTAANLAQGNLSPQTIMIGNISYSGIVTGIEGKVTNDMNGPSGGVDGTTLAGITVNLYDASESVLIATTTSDAAGNYHFDVPTNTGYVVKVVPAAGYQSVSSTDPTPQDSKTSVSVGVTSVTGIDFGLNLPPIATDDVLNDQIPGTPVTIQNILENDTDPGGGTLSTDNISLVQPPSAVDVQPDAQGDVIGFTVTGQGTWDLNNNTGEVTFKPIPGFIGDPTPVAYKVADAAGLISDPADLTVHYKQVILADYGDLPYNGASVDYPKVKAAFSDADNNNIPDDANAVWLGTLIDAESDGFTNPPDPGDYAKGDDKSGVADEDGLKVNGIMAPGTVTWTITANSNQPATVHYGMWVDWGTPTAAPDGAFDDFYSGTIATASPASQTVSVTVPASFQRGSVVNVRLMANPAALDQATGFSTDLANGEIEDFQFTFDEAMPVRLVSFQAKISENNVELTWKAADQENFDRYEVERSPDGRDFSRIASVNGNGETAGEYSFEDRNAAAKGNTFYYRLKMIDADGTFAYGTMKMVQFKTLHTITVWPTVLAKGQQIMVALPPGDWFDVQLVSQSGKMMSEKRSNGTGQLQFETQNLARGLYLIKVIGQDGEHITAKIAVIQ